ncbi:hypothetical protein HK099_007182 [Clydaea vesicula]|uniref:C2H2-type domain-containing protein n=1 Tax=Clydaea vesicula TaxID=447962 RepID=A0AAD5TXH3_9FUNG|nr:hypothetical protein HK099_007182 [Clydaea vesicula]
MIKENSFGLQTNAKPDKPFHCEYCPLVFARSHDLKRHTYTHTEKPFSCQRCGKGFCRKDALLRHHTAFQQGKKVHCISTT